jgi:intein/homing endonuclease
MSYNEETQKYEVKRVLKTYSNNLTNYFLINNKLKARSDEMVYVINYGWKFIKDLEINDQILTVDNSNYSINSIEQIYDTEKFYALTIEGNHSFILNGMVVHNEPKPII